MDTRSSVLPRWQEACAYLAVAEPLLEPLFRKYHPERLVGSGDGFQTLANAITGQQISVKAAASIWQRLNAAVGSMTPQRVLAVPEQRLREAGLSVRKVQYLQGLARAFAAGEIDPARWPEQDDRTVIHSLVQFKGIGQWTAEMFLIFHLHRPDVLPLDDIGLLKAAARLFSQEGKMDPRELAHRAEVWRPWRTVATWYLWRSLDPTPVVY
jgi:DNA-3-methyladenine glycosylase II